MKTILTIILFPIHILMRLSEVSAHLFGYFNDKLLDIISPPKH